MTYEELKAKLNALAPEQLAMDVRWWGEDRGGKVYALDVLDEQWVNVSGDGLEPASDYDGDPDVRAGIEAGEFDMVPKGTPILSVDD